MKQPDLPRLIDWVRWGSSRFNESNLYFGHGTNNSWDEAMYLVLHALCLPPDCDDIVYYTYLSEEEKLEVFNLLVRRIETKKPASYLTNESWLSGFNFYVNENVLIPRSPFAELIEKHFEPWVYGSKINRILEIGTGSGCLAILAAHAWPEAEIDAVDVSSDAIEVARQNIENYGLQDQINLIKSDLFENVNGQYDLIIANPPYVSDEEWKILPDEYHHEPKLALVADDEGLEIPRRILKDAANYLSDNGALFLEVGAEWSRFDVAFSEYPLAWVELEHGGEGIAFIGKSSLLKG